MALSSTLDMSVARGDALLLSGDIDGSLDAYSAVAGSAAGLEPGIAWRIGLVHYMLRGSPKDALEQMTRGRLAGEGTADEALLLGWLASAHWALGDIDSCADFAGRAVVAAQKCASDRALAAAHVALALLSMLTGDRAGNAAHYAKALRFAAAAGDDLQLIRIRMNRASHYIDEACFVEALEDLSVAEELAEPLGNTVLLAIALTNEGTALTGLGRLTEAAECFRRSIQHCQQAGSSKICFGLLGLGDVHRRRGQTALARAAYEEVIPLAGQHGHVQVLVPALAGLAMVLSEVDNDAALVIAQRARALSVGPFVTVALLAMAHVTLSAGSREMAAQLAQEAQRSARAHRDRAAMAHALELQAETCEDWQRAGRYLAEARSIWTDIGAIFDADRVTVTLGRLPMVTTETYADSNLAAERLAAAGLSPSSSPSRIATGSSAPATIRTLGRFEVLVAGKPIQPSAWQSRKARDLLRLLVARRGRPATRDELADLLWSDEQGANAERRAHRLAVALSIVRGVLDGNRQSNADSVVIADGSSVALDISRIVIDLETFMRQADHGLRRYGRAQSDEGRAVLVAAERLYTGDFLEDEPYEDWTATPREQARATYLRVARTLADAALKAGETDEVIHYLLRILAMDGYDEQSHLDLIDSYSGAGRHGEARRAKDRYAVAMREIGVGVRP